MIAQVGSQPIVIPRNGTLGFDSARNLCAYDVRAPLTSYVENSICEPEVGSLEWAYDWVYGTNAVAEVARHSDGNWVVNPNLLTGGYRQRINVFCAGPGTISVKLQVIAKRFAATHNEVRLTITDAGSGNAVSNRFVLGADWTVCEITKSVTAGASYWAFVNACFETPGDIGDNRFIVKSVKIIPTAASGIFSGDFIRLGLANVSCNQEMGLITASLVPNQSALAFKRFRTDAAFAACEYRSTMQAYYVNQAHIGMIGESQEYPLLPGLSELAYWNMSSMPGTWQRFDLLSGATVLTGGAVQGSYLRALYLPKDCRWALAAVAPDWVVYGDSISAGFGSDCAPLEGYTALLRKAVDGKLAVEAYGNRRLHADASSSELRNALAEKLAGFGAHKYVIAIGTNDYGLTPVPVATFGTEYGATLDALHAADPDAQVFCVTPIVRDPETGNVNGDTLPDFRSAIATAVSTRTAFCTLIDGTTLMDADDLDVTGVHPTSAGHAAMAAALEPLLGI